MHFGMYAAVKQRRDFGQRNARFTLVNSPDRSQNCALIAWNIASYLFRRAYSLRAC